jgi:putative lipoprotein
MTWLISKKPYSLVAVVVLSLGCGYLSNPAFAAEVELAGVALYRERIALPEDVIFDATLEEYSQAETQSKVIGRAHVVSPGQSPIKFSIAYDRAHVNPAYRYTVRAKLVHGDQLMLIADAVNVLMTNDKTNVVLMLRKAPTAITRSVVDLENTYWRLDRLGPESVNSRNARRESYFLLQPARNRVVGFGGCNALSSTYRLDGSSISFTKPVGVLIPCEKHASAESAFHRALAKAKRWSISGERLELFDSTGQSLAQFESRYQK